MIIGELFFLFIFDDLFWYVCVYREIYFLLRRFVGREVYLGEIFFVYFWFLERFVKLLYNFGGGSFICFLVIEILVGDVLGYISINVIFIIDG